MKDVSDKAHKELTPDVVYRIFEDHYITTHTTFHVDECHYTQGNGILAEATIHYGDEVNTINGIGNGRLDSVSNAIKQFFDISYELSFYEEHSLTKGSSSKAIAYVGVVCNGKNYWGAGIDADIIKASVDALVVAVNKIDEIKNFTNVKDTRLIEILNYIHAHYSTVTLEELSEHFFLSKPYLSKYIREKSGTTYGEIVKTARLKKAKALLKGGNMTVENISVAIGYHNVEHFNRLFKKTFKMTPVQFRNSKG